MQTRDGLGATGVGMTIAKDASIAAFGPPEAPEPSTIGNCMIRLSVLSSLTIGSGCAGRCAFRGVARPIAH